MEQGTAQDRPKSAWWREQTPEELQENPHHPCGRDDSHDGHGWRGVAEIYDGAVKVYQTLWCEGAPGE